MFTILIPIGAIILVHQKIIPSFEKWGINPFIFFLLFIIFISTIPVIFLVSKIKKMSIIINEIKTSLYIKEGKSLDEVKFDNINSLFKEIDKIKREIRVLQFENRILYDTALAIHNTDSIQELLDIILARLTTHTHADFGLIFLLENQELNLKAYSNVLDKDIKKTSFKIGEGLVGWSVHKNEPILAEDVQVDSRYINCINNTKAQITIPIKMYGIILGVLVLGSEETSHFSDSDFKLIKTISGEIGLAINNAKLTDNLKKENQNNHMLFELTKKITSSVDLNEVGKIGVKTVTEVINAKSCILAVFDEVDQELKVIASHGTFKDRLQFIELKGTVEEAFKEKYPTKIETDGGYSYCIPIASGEKSMGILHLNTDRLLTKEEIDLINSTITPLSSALENAFRYKSVESLAIRDGLTNMYNRRYFNEVLGDYIEKCKKHNGNLSLVMLDIDNYKKYNDTYGHQLGDILLKKVAEVLESNLREEDIISRYGGDEFTIILPDTDIEAARNLMETIRENISNYKFEVEEEYENKEKTILEPEEKNNKFDIDRLFGKELKKWFTKKVRNNKSKPVSKSFNITISVGISSLIDTNYTKEMLIKKADEAALESKRKGKNKVNIWIP
jgi:diguanylate cyclase (GGDEF)-like protein